MRAFGHVAAEQLAEKFAVEPAVHLWYTTHNP